MAQKTLRNPPNMAEIRRLAKGRSGMAIHVPEWRTASPSFIRRTEIPGHDRESKSRIVARGNRYDGSRRRAQKTLSGARALAAVFYRRRGTFPVCNARL